MPLNLQVINPSDKYLFMLCTILKHAVYCRNIQLLNQKLSHWSHATKSLNLLAENVYGKKFISIDGKKNQYSFVIFSLSLLNI